MLEQPPSVAAPCLSTNLVAQGDAVRAKYGPHIGWHELLRILADRAFVSYACEIRFDDEPLLRGEFAHPVPRGLNPEDGYIIYVHPSYAAQLDRVPYLVLCHIPFLNFGPSVSVEDGETFGSHALGLSREGYYAALCDSAMEIGGDDLC